MIAMPLVRNLPHAFAVWTYHTPIQNHLLYLGASCSASTLGARHRFQLLPHPPPGPRPFQDASLPPPCKPSASSPPSLGRGDKSDSWRRERPAATPPLSPTLSPSLLPLRPRSSGRHTRLPRSIARFDVPGSKELGRVGLGTCNKSVGKRPSNSVGSKKNEGRGITENVRGGGQNLRCRKKHSNGKTRLGKVQK